MLNDLLKGRMRDITPKNRRGCFSGMSGGGCYYILKNASEDESVVAPGTYEALKDMVVNDRIVQFVAVEKNELGSNVRVMSFVSLDEDGVIRGNVGEVYAFEVHPDNTGDFYYNE